MTLPSLCFLDQHSQDKSDCLKYGGEWDPIEYQQTPSSQYTCSVNKLFKGSTNCWNGCTNQTFVDPYSQFTYTFHGECEAYSLCTINATTRSSCLSAGSNVFWKIFDYSVYALVDSTSVAAGLCVIFYENKYSPFEDSGGMQSISDEITCRSTVVTIAGKASAGQWKPGRSYRAGFLDSSQACGSGICPSQLYVILLQSFYGNLCYFFYTHPM